MSTTFEQNSKKKSDEQGQSMNNTTLFKTKEDNLHYTGVMDIDPRELNEVRENVVLVDVRQPDEFNGDLGHIPGARLIVLDTLPEHLHELPKNETIVFICRSGGRSARATAIALEHGFKNVFNLKGGMILWNELHFETEA